MIHKFFLNGYYIVIDSNSGAVHVVDELAYELLDFTDADMEADIPDKALLELQKKYSVGDIKAAYSELFSLKENGMLYSPDVYEVFADKMVGASLKSMCINIAHDCNLRCEYCFAAKGDFGGERILMNFETAKRAIDFLVDKSVGRHNLEVDFFGGEPLMNFDTVVKTVQYARSIEEKHNKNFRFTLTTNGLLLDDEKIDFINREMHNVVLSLDGRKEVNDRLRVTPNSKGCYDVIVPKYQKLVQTRGDKDYYVRATFTSNNLDFTEDVLHLYELGFSQLSEEPVVSDPKLDYSIREEDLPKVFDEYERLAKKLIDMKRSGEKINFFHFMIDLDQGPCAIRRLRGCSCGNEYVAVTPEGDIYPCHQFVGDSSHKMGNLYEGTYDTAMKREFAKATIYSKEKCRTCWARFYCSGGCNANNHQYEGDILKPHSIYCQLEKKRLECAIMMKAALI